MTSELESIGIESSLTSPGSAIVSCVTEPAGTLQETPATRSRLSTFDGFSTSSITRPCSDTHGWRSRYLPGDPEASLSVANSSVVITSRPIGILQRIAHRLADKLFPPGRSVAWLVGRPTVPSRSLIAAHVLSIRPKHDDYRQQQANATRDMHYSGDTVRGIRRAGIPKFPDRKSLSVY